MGWTPTERKHPRNALVAGVVEGVVGMVGVMVLSYARAAIAAIEERTDAAEARLEELKRG